MSQVTQWPCACLSPREPWEEEFGGVEGEMERTGPWKGTFGRSQSAGQDTSNSCYPFGRGLGSHDTILCPVPTLSLMTCGLGSFTTVASVCVILTLSAAVPGLWSGPSVGCFHDECSVVLDLRSWGSRVPILFALVDYFVVPCGCKTLCPCPCPLMGYHPVSYWPGL